MLLILQFTRNQVNIFDTNEETPAKAIENIGMDKKVYLSHHDITEY